MIDSDSDDESSIEAEVDDDKSANHDIEQQQDVRSNITNKVDDSEGDSMGDDQKPKAAPSAALGKGERQNDEQQGEDLDALLEEFKLQDKDPGQDCEPSEKPQASTYGIVMSCEHRCSEVVPESQRPDPLDVDDRPFFLDLLEKDGFVLLTMSAAAWECRSMTSALVLCLGRIVK
jgi:hypothetical protein